MSVPQAAQAVVQNPQQLQRAQPERNHPGRLIFFADGVRLHVHVVAGVGENRSEHGTDGHGHAGFQQRQHPVKIAEIAPAGVKEKAAFMNHAAPDENRAGQKWKTEPDMARVGHHELPMANIFSRAVGDDAAGERDLDARIFFKKILHRRERARQVLFIAIQIRQDVAGGAAITPVHRVIHAAVLFDERLHARIVRQPVLRAVVRAGILHDVLQFHARLVGDGRDAELEPFRIAKTRRDDRKLHLRLAGPWLCFFYRAQNRLRKVLTYLI